MTKVLKSHIRVNQVDESAPALDTNAMLTSAFDEEVAKSKFGDLVSTLVKEVDAKTSNQHMIEKGLQSMCCSDDTFIETYNAVEQKWLRYRKEFTKMDKRILEFKEGSGIPMDFEQKEQHLYSFT